jgi:hypothetical protein
MKKQTGIWLDLRNAWIINLPAVADGETIVDHISSEIEESAAVGGTRSKTPWGPQGGDNQRSVEERRHHEEKHYFELILKQVHPDTEELVIFGPSEAKHGLENMLEKQHKAPKIMGVKSADQMTQNQMVAWVREFYGRPAPRKQPGVGREHEE